MNHNEDTEYFGAKIPLEYIEYVRDYIFHKTGEVGVYTIGEALLDAISALREACPVNPRPEIVKQRQDDKRAKRVANIANAKQRRKLKPPIL